MLRLSQLFNFLFFLWTEIGSVLDPPLTKGIPGSRSS